MADYTSYTTDAIILSRVSRGEHDIAVTCLTRSLGIISAVSRSARKDTSKQRYGLTIGAQSSLTLVRGRQWRIVSVLPQRSDSFPAGIAAPWRHTMKTVEIVLPHGVDDRRMFEAVEAITTTAYGIDSQAEQAELFELWAQARVLHVAGMLEAVGGYMPHERFEVSALQIRERKDAFAGAVNRGLHALGILMQ